MSDSNGTPQLYCGKTVEDIRAMRIHHGHLFVVEVKDEEEVFHAVCKEPTLQVLEAAQAVSKTSEVKGAMALYSNCVVEADEAIKSRDLLKLQVASAIGDKAGALRATAKNV
jgi:hypothetical protein